MDTQNPQSDHDLLIVLHTEMKGMRIDIKNLSDGISAKVSDHETRLRTLEKSIEDCKNISKDVTDLKTSNGSLVKLTDNLMLKMVIGTTIVSMIMALVSALVLAFLKKQLGL